MSIQDILRHHWRLAVALALAAGAAEEVRAQLAITEVMSVATAITNTTLRRPDYWELTNFGTNNLTLDGYGFRDADPAGSLVRYPFTNLVIRAGESIICFRVRGDASECVTNPAQFRAWWGESQLPPGLQFRTWRDPGLSGWDGDAVWLFDPFGNLVDCVQFGTARAGRAFTYQSETGAFGVLSADGVDGAFAAENGGDIGSPGITTGPVPVRIVQEPLDQSADAGMTVSVTVGAASLPRPRYQWFAHGIPIPNATSATLTLPNVQPADAGPYYVCVTNWLAAATSRVATLTVNTNPTSPVIVSPPVDATVFAGQTAVFTVLARAFPAPTYQWQSNGIDLLGATGATLKLENVGAELSGTRYSVRVWNALGTTNLSATLIVTPRPDLRFTEVMALPANEEQNRHFDWFELTNFDTNAVNLLGWRFCDEPAFARALTITNPLTLQPGESAVFAERLDQARFAAWWGPDSLPETLHLCTYSGLGLRATGETLYLWNPAALDAFDFVATASWAAATPGISFEGTHYCDPEGYGCLDECSTDSVPGVRGAFRALDGGDIGSPGYVANPPLRILSVNRGPAGAIDLRCRVEAGKAYRLGRTPSLWAPDWTPLPAHPATNNVLTLTDQVPDTTSAWFYCVEQVQ